MNEHEPTAPIIAVPRKPDGRCSCHVELKGRAKNMEESLSVASSEGYTPIAGAFNRFSAGAGGYFIIYVEA